MAIDIQAEREARIISAAMAILGKRKKRITPAAIQQRAEAGKASGKARLGKKRGHYARRKKKI